MLFFTHTPNRHAQRMAGWAPYRNQPPVPEGQGGPQSHPSLRRVRFPRATLPVVQERTATAGQEQRDLWGKELLLVIKWQPFTKLFLWTCDVVSRDSQLWLWFFKTSSVSHKFIIRFDVSYDGHK